MIKVMNGSSYLFSPSGFDPLLTVLPETPDDVFVGQDVLAEDVVEEVITDAKRQTTRAKTETDKQSNIH